jgi:60 kDa SS-A/Ro ribonucleoprotein
MANYARHLAPPAPPTQSQPLPGQVANSGGGFAFEISCWDRLDRFLVLGCEGGTYYATERKLTIENAACILECAKADPGRTVARIAEISTSGRAPKNDPAIFALAYLAAQPGLVSGYALEIGLPKVCRTGTHLFQFVEIVTQLRGWGRALRRGVSNWYTSKDDEKLAMQVTKYAQRNGWSHRDLLRLAHPVGKNPGQRDVFQYIAQRDKWLNSKKAGTRTLVMVEEAKTASLTRLKSLIKNEGLVREHIPTERLNEPSIWEALLENMPITAMIRNLNKMTATGVVAPLSEGTRKVVETLNDREVLKRGRVHPFNLLVALKTYKQGHGVLGSLRWTPVPQVVSALEDAFYLAFDTIQPTGKNHLFGIDVSGSMSSPALFGNSISCATAAACLAMVGLRTEPNSYAFGFAHQFKDLGITKNDRLEQVEKKVQGHNFGSTDCATAYNWALAKKLDVDAFVIITDNETNCGRVHPATALRNYRKSMGKPEARAIVIGMTAAPFSIAEPSDPLQLDVVGFDSAAPAIIADFVRGFSVRPGEAMDD